MLDEYSAENARHTVEDLKELQSYPLDVKIELTKSRIKSWLRNFDTYISFSGGKDSTVLLDIVRQIDDSVPAVFVDTGLEFPEIRDFVRLFKNVEWLRPKENFKQVILKYGYPMVSKEIAQDVYEVRRYGKERAKKRYERFIPDSDYNKKWGGQYSCERYAFLLDEGAPMLSHKCCSVMKKEPVKQYESTTGRRPFVATMAEESRSRRQNWLKNGCNVYNGKRQVSKPMSFWTEQDVLLYLKINHDGLLAKIKDDNPGIAISHPWATVYGEIVEDGEMEGQCSLCDYFNEVTLSTSLKLKTTAQKRTGCMFCGFGCSARDWDNLIRMKQTHPKQYEYIMRPLEHGGLGFKAVIDYMNEKGEMKIRY